MRVSIGIVVLAALGAGACSPPVPSGPGDEASLRSAITTYDSAWMAKNEGAVAALLDDGYTYFTSRGGLNDKAATLGFLADTSYQLTLSRRTEVRIIMAESTAGVSSRWEGEGRFRGEVVQDDQTCGQTWLQRNGRWLLFTEHCVNRPASTAEPA